MSRLPIRLDFVWQPPSPPPPPAVLEGVRLVTATGAALLERDPETLTREERADRRRVVWCLLELC